MMHDVLLVNFKVCVSRTNKKRSVIKTKRSEKRMKCAHLTQESLERGLHSHMKQIRPALCANTCNQLTHARVVNNRMHAYTTRVETRAETRRQTPRHSHKLIKVMQNEKLRERRKERDRERMNRGEEGRRRLFENGVSPND